MKLRIRTSDPTLPDELLKFLLLIVACALFVFAVCETGS
jgi:hypothetical protein